MPRNKVVITKTDTKVINGAIAGPKGEKGDTGIVTALADLPDVSLESLNNDDTLQYNSTTMQWTNRPKEDIVDGGNF